MSDTRLPLIQYCPIEGESRQPIRFINVDFPEPEGPMIARYSPFLTSNDTSRRACSSSVPIWYVFQMFCIEIRVSVAGRVPLPLTVGSVSATATSFSMNRYITVVGCQLSVVGCRSSVVSCQSSVFGCQLEKLNRLTTDD